MSKGDAAHAAQHQHGVIPRKEPQKPLTVEERLAKVEEQVAGLIIAREEHLATESLVEHNKEVITEAEQAAKS